MSPVSRSLIIGVAGGSGSGKTTVARAIRKPLGVNAVLLDADSYYCDMSHLSLEERKTVNYDHPEAFDVPLLVEQLERLATGQPIDKPLYDYARHVRSATVLPVESKDVILVDGIMLFADARLRPLFDIKVFVDVAEDIRFIRRLQRDLQERGRSLESVIDQYLTTVRPMHLEFVEPSKRYADVILPEGGDNRIGIEMVRARVQQELLNRRVGSAP